MHSTLPSSLPFRRSSLGAMVMSSTSLLIFTIGALIIGLALLILFHQNTNATKGYNLRSLEVVRNQLLIQQETLNTDIAKAQSLATLQSDAVVTRMMKPTKPVYVRVETPIALRLSR